MHIDLLKAPEHSSYQPTTTYRVPADHLKLLDEDLDWTPARETGISSRDAPKDFATTKELDDLKTQLQQLQDSFNESIHELANIEKHDYDDPQADWLVDKMASELQEESDVELKHHLQQTMKDLDIINSNLKKR